MQYIFLKKQGIFKKDRMFCEIYLLFYYRIDFQKIMSFSYLL